MKVMGIIDFGKHVHFTYRATQICSHSDFFRYGKYSGSDSGSVNINESYGKYKINPTTGRNIHLCSQMYKTIVVIFRISKCKSNT